MIWLDPLYASSGHLKIQMICIWADTCITIPNKILAGLAYIALTSVTRPL